MNKIPNITPNVNCGVGRDTGCQSGYCGYFDDTSPIDLSNMFGVLLNDILDFGAPSGFLSKFRTLSIGQDNPDSGPTGATGSSTNNFCRDEGAYVQLGGCCSDGTSIAKSGACDWKHCYPWVYQCGRFKKSCSRAECLKDPYCNLNISPSPPATYSPLKAPTPNYTYVSSYACATPNLAKPAIDSSGNYIFDQNGRQLYCPLMRGNIPTNSICIYLNDGGENNCYTDKVPPFSPNFDDAWGFNFWNDYLNDTDLKVTSSGSDQTCIEANYPGLSSIFTPGSYLTTACKYSNNFPTGATNPPTCFLDRSCFDDSSLLTRAKISVIGKFMQCYNETINNLFFTAPNSGNCKAIVLEFQKGMRRTLQIALILYVIAIGIKIAAGGQLPKKGEIMMFIIKIGAVIYFGVGTFNDSSDSNDDTNGLVMLYQKGFIVMNELANRIIQSGNESESASTPGQVTPNPDGSLPGFCVFDAKNIKINSAI